MCAAPTLAATGMERVGNAAAVRGIVQLAAISGVREIGKKVASGEPIFLGDRVTTGPEGRLQIMLLDETVFTIGPKAAIVIDEFVYDPKTSKGKVAASVLKGTFRFVTGKVSKRDPSKMVVKLPVGSIGVRGTSVAGGVSITTTSAFTSIGTASFPLLANPFASGSGPVDISENGIALSGPLTGGVANFNYKFLNTNGVIFGELVHKLSYTDSVTGTGVGKLQR